MFYPMLADVYFSVSVQAPSGEMEDIWEFSESVPCELKTGSFNTEMRYALQTYDEFFALPTVVYGRFDRDIQIQPDGTTVPFTSLLVTNIRTRTCDDTGPVVFTEDRGSGLVPIVYEVRSISPFINPWGVAEHYKTQLMRADNQVTL